MSKTTFIPKEVHRKQLITAILLTAIILFPLIAGITWVVADQLTETIVEEGSMSSESSYIGFRVGSNYYYRNGKTGAVSTAYANPVTMFEYVTNTLMSGGGEFFIEEGQYQLTSTWNITSSGVTVRGEGWATIINASAATAHYNLITFGNSPSEISNVALYDLQINGWRAGKTGSHPEGNLYNGLIRTIGPSRNIIVDSCWVLSAKGCAFTSDPSATLRHTRMVITNNHIEDMFDALNNTGTCDTAGDFAGVDYGIWSHNTIVDTENGGFWLVDCRWGVVTSNTVDGDNFNVRNGHGLSAPVIGLYSGCKFMTISNNAINATEKGIYLNGVDTTHNVVSGNTLAGPFDHGQEAGIYFWSVNTGSNNTVTGNVIFGSNAGGSTGILEEAGWDHNVIVGNVINNWHTAVSISGANTIEQHNIKD